MYDVFAMNQNDKELTYYFSLERSDDGTFSVIKESYTKESWPKKVGQVKMFSGIQDENMSGVVLEICRALKPNVWEDVKEKLNVVSLSELVFMFCNDTLGTGWDIKNAHKLLNPFFIWMWVGAWATRRMTCYDIFDNSITADKIVNALSEGIKKCMKLYLPREYEAMFEAEE